MMRVKVYTSAISIHLIEEKNFITLKKTRTKVFHKNVSQGCNYVRSKKIKELLNIITCFFFFFFKSVYE